MDIQLPPLKSGFKTSDLYYSIFVSLFGMVVTAGILTPEQADSFTKGIVEIVGGLTTLLPVVQYLYLRYVLKKVQMQNAVSTTVSTVVTAPPVTTSTAPVEPAQYIPQPVE